MKNKSVNRKRKVTKKRRSLRKKIRGGETLENVNSILELFIDNFDFEEFLQVNGIQNIGSDYYKQTCLKRAKFISNNIANQGGASFKLWTLNDVAYTFFNMINPQKDFIDYLILNIFIFIDYNNTIVTIIKARKKSTEPLGDVAKITMLADPNTKDKFRQIANFVARAVDKYKRIYGEEPKEYMQLRPFYNRS